MNKEMDKKLDELLANMPKPEYDLDAWLAEDETEEFDRLQRMNTDLHRSKRKVWRWVAAACLLLIIGIGVTTLQEGVQTSELLPARSVERVLTTELPQQGSVEGVLASEQPQQDSIERVLTPKLPSRSRSRKMHTRNSLPDTLGTGIWLRRENVETALRILTECEADIERSEQQVRNDIIEATFRATPQPANVILVSDENGDYEVQETKRIINI